MWKVTIWKLGDSTEATWKRGGVRPDSQSMRWSWGGLAPAGTSVSKLVLPPRQSGDPKGGLVKGGLAMYVFSLCAYETLGSVVDVQKKEYA